MHRLPCFTLIALLTSLTPLADAKTKKPKAAPEQPKDEIAVVGHIPAGDGPVRRFLATQHYSSFYLYAEHEAGNGATLIDITNTERAHVLATVPVAPGGGADSLSMVVGTAALVTSVPANAAPVAAPQTIRIMDFSDPQSPKVAREFTGVTAISRDDSRGLVFVANADGIWILRRHFAEDPEVNKAYADYVLYNR